MVLDEFVIAHTLGWWAKALMLRHSGMCVTDGGVLSVVANGLTPPPTNTQAVGRLHSFRAFGALVSGACTCACTDTLAPRVEMTLNVLAAPAAKLQRVLVGPLAA
jgi:hypothetical protein